MKFYLVTAKFPTNLDSFEVAIKAENIVDAQDKFFYYLATLDVYKHMWNLQVNFQEIKDILE